MTHSVMIQSENNYSFRKLVIHAQIQLNPTKSN
jgi:hypothetical protein